MSGVSGGMDAAANTVEISRAIDDTLARIEVKKKLSLRAKVVRWLLGDLINPPMIVSMPNTERAIKNEAMEQEQKALRNVPAVAIRIISAENGKIVVYRKPGDEKLGRIQINDESYYLVKEGENVLDAIARCMALDKLK